MNRTKYSCPRRVAGMRLLCVSIIFGFGCNVVLGQTVGSNEGGTVPQPVPEFPANNWWNTDISKAPVDPKSANYISFVNNGGTRHLHPDFGGNASYGGPNATYGFPYVVVDGVAGTGKSPPPLKAVQFAYSDQSDGVNHTTNTAFPFYPIPAQAITTPRWIECGDPGNVDDRSCDRHLLIIDRDHKYLYELWNVYYDTMHSQWDAGSGAFFDMTKSARRPAGWTSADAAGLAVFPGLVRYDEVYNAYGTNVTDINHAFRVTVRSTNSYVYPASHVAGSTAGALPMGARLRLKAGTVISGFNPQMQKIFRAMKTYGLIVADNGSDMYISGTYDTHWDNNNILNPAFGALNASNFEVIKLGWQPPLYTLPVTPNPVVGGTAATGTATLLVAAPTTGAVVTLTAASPLSVPVSVTVPAGKISANFTVKTSAVASNTNATVTGTYSGAEIKTVVTVEVPVALKTFTVNPLTVASGGTATGTVAVNENSPTGGTLVALKSSNTAVATVPASVTVPAGKSSVSFTVTAKTVAVKTTVTISATYSGITKNVALTVN